MKENTKVRTFYFLVGLFMTAHFLYYSSSSGALLPLILYLVGSWPVLLLFYAALEPKRIRSPDYSELISLPAIPVAFFSLGLYFSYFLGFWENAVFPYFVFFVVAGYFIFLNWYKNGWRG